MFGRVLVGGRGPRRRHAAPHGRGEGPRELRGAAPREGRGGEPRDERRLNAALPRHDKRPRKVRSAAAARRGSASHDELRLPDSAMPQPGPGHVRMLRRPLLCLQEDPGRRRCKTGPRF